MIVHIMAGERYHLVPGIAKGFITTYAADAQHRILIVGSNSIDRARYEQLFNGLGYFDYSFCTSKKKLIKYLWNNRENTILHHGESFLYFVALFSFIFRIHSLNWVCWGDAVKISKGGRSVFFNPFKIFFYNKFHSIITLMEDDKFSIIKDFKYPAEKIRTIAYAQDGEMNNRDRACAKIRSEKNKVFDKVRVLAGNNPGNIPYYNCIIDLLSSFNGKIEIHFMMNYSVVKNKQYEEFIEHGKSVFGNDFYSDEDFFTDPELYACYMNSYDIYICANPKQTGLGALYTMLQLGKKIYITGKNYNWLQKGIGSIVYDISDISDFNDFVRPLTNEEQDYNNQQILDFKKQAPDQWHNYLREIDN